MNKYETVYYTIFEIKEDQEYRNFDHLRQFPGWYVLIEHSWSKRTELDGPYIHNIYAKHRAEQLYAAEYKTCGLDNNVLPMYVVIKDMNNVQNIARMKNNYGFK